MVELDGESLTIEDVVAVARDRVEVASLSEAVRVRMHASRDWVEKTIQRGKDILYGVNTGFGPLANQSIAPEQTRLLSRYVTLACVVGVGSPLPQDVIRAMMLIRANALVKGFSGTRPVIVQTLIDMLNAGITPFVPSKGSLGASGDLAPLAHMTVVFSKDLIEEGEDYSGQAWFDGELLSGAEAMAHAGIPRLILDAKEGLALTNGTSCMAAGAALTLADGEKLIQQAEIAAALSLEALMGLSAAFHPALHQVNNQPGQVQTAANIRRLLQGSRLIDSAPERIQDAYSLRCIAQVVGPVRDIFSFVRERVSAAINAATDNPLIFLDLPDSPDGKVLSGGNFHGEGLAMWLDILGIALAGVGNISERRTFRLLTKELSDGLPSMLVPSPGLNTGLMMPQYTAAALVSDNKTLAHPDSVDSIPSSGNQEDFVSMGANAARHAMEIAENVRNILAIEMMTAAQGIDLRPDGPARLAPGTAAAFKKIRSRVKFLEHDRALAPDIEAIAELIRCGEVAEAVREVLGPQWGRE